MRNTEGELAKIAEATGDFVAGVTNTTRYVIRQFPIGVTAEEEQEYQARKRGSGTYQLGKATAFGLMAAAYAAVVIGGASVLPQ